MSTPQHPAAPETETDANGLIEAEREALIEAGLGRWFRMNALQMLTVERILAARHAAILADLNAARERVRVVEGERDAAVRSKAALVAKVQRLQDQIARAEMEPGQDRQKAMHAYAARAESAEAAHEAEKAAHERLRADLRVFIEAHDNENWRQWGIPQALRSLLGGGEAR